MLLKNILVVDDEEQYRNMLKVFLSAVGYNCDVAMDSIEAMEKLNNGDFDIVVSDIKMHGQDGVELMREVKKRQPHLEFIIMTGYATEYAYKDIIAAGASDFIAKPFETAELKAKLDRIEREKQTLRQLEKANEELRRAYRKLETILEQTIHALAAAIETRDAYTAGHQRRVARLAAEMARAMGLSEEQVQVIRLAGLIHDIGKVSVPAEILSKPTKLEELEMRLIREHARIGYEILKDIDFPWPIAEMVLQHHERMDGSGYPQGLRGEDILLEARILAVADVVEAMASHRPYRAQVGIEKALQEISDHKGTLYDAQVVDSCLRLFRDEGFQFE